MALLTYQSTQIGSALSSSSYRINKPTSLTVGDLMFTKLNYNQSTLFSVPSGFNTLVTTTTTNLRETIFWKIADSGDVSASYFDFSTSGSAMFYGTISRFTGTDSTTPVTLYSAFTGSSTTISPPTLTPTSKNSIIILSATTVANTATYSGYSIAIDNPTFTEIVDSGNIGGFFSSCLAISNLRTNITATGTGNITSTGTPTQTIGHMIIINPSITSSIITETITTSETIHKMVSSIFTATVSVTDSILQTLSRLWNKVSKPVTTWRNRNKN